MKILVAFLMLFAFTFAEAKGKKSKECELALNYPAIALVYLMRFDGRTPDEALYLVENRVISVYKPEKKCNMTEVDAGDEILNRALKLVEGTVNFD